MDYYHIDCFRKCTDCFWLLRTLVIVYMSFGVNFQISNQELLHAVVALYDSCLPEITPEVLYPTVCGKWAKTLVLLRDFQGTCMQLLNTPKVYMYRSV